MWNEKFKCGQQMLPYSLPAKVEQNMESITSFKYTWLLGSSNTTKVYYIWYQVKAYWLSESSVCIKPLHWGNWRPSVSSLITSSWLELHNLVCHIRWHQHISQFKIIPFYTGLKNTSNILKTLHEILIEKDKLKKGGRMLAWLKHFQKYI